MSEISENSNYGNDETLVPDSEKTLLIHEAIVTALKLSSLAIMAYGAAKASHEVIWDKDYFDAALAGTTSLTLVNKMIP